MLISVVKSMRTKICGAEIIFRVSQIRHFGKLKHTLPFRVAETLVSS